MQVLAAFFLPPLYFVRCQRPRAALAHALLEVVTLGSILWVSGGGPNRRSLIIPLAVLLWLHGVAHAVADFRARRRVPVAPAAGLGVRKRATVALIGLAAAAGIYPSVLVVQSLLAYADQPLRWPGRQREAHVEARWAVELALRHRRDHDRNPGSLERLNQAYPDDPVAMTDPWGRPWVLSPAFRGTSAPADDGDLWVCSRGVRGTGPCPPPGWESIPYGSVGHSAQFGYWWGPEVDRGWFESGFIGVVTWVPFALIGYPLARLMWRRLERRHSSTPRWPWPATDGFCVLYWLLLPVVVAATLFGHQHDRDSPAIRYIRDSGRIARAVDQYQQATDTMPPSLVALTSATVDQAGRTVGPFLDAVPVPSPGYTRYRYRPWSDGTYTIATYDPVSGDSYEFPSLDLGRGVGVRR